MKTALADRDAGFIPAENGEICLRKPRGKEGI